jgi:hypothetical protein
LFFFVRAQQLCFVSLRGDPDSLADGKRVLDQSDNLLQPVSLEDQEAALVDQLIL